MGAAFDIFDDEIQTIDEIPAQAAAALPARRPGRPFGSKTQGRDHPVAAIPAREQITRAAPAIVASMIDLVEGKPLRIGQRLKTMADGSTRMIPIYGVASLELRSKVGIALLHKVAADIKSTEITGGDKPVRIDSRNLNVNVAAEPLSPREMVNGALLKAVEFHQRTGLAMPPALVRELPQLSQSMAATAGDEGA